MTAGSSITNRQIYDMVVKLIKDVDGIVPIVRSNEIEIVKINGKLVSIDALSSRISKHELLLVGDGKLGEDGEGLVSAVGTIKKKMAKVELMQYTILVGVIVAIITNLIK